MAFWKKRQIPGDSPGPRLKVGENPRSPKILSPTFGDVPERKIPVPAEPYFEPLFLLKTKEPIKIMAIDRLPLPTPQPFFSTMPLQNYFVKA